ncbi:discoidin domain-containing protein [Streptomyces sp. NPDC090106]|uniref:discoidin domain-containing protein n=1 Tax=Streptomyces sp. NPDC090106 TaxID=3365946 RepID=UPI0037F138EF
MRRALHRTRHRLCRERLGRRDDASWPSLDARYVRVTLTGAYSAATSWSITEARLQTQPVTAPAGSSLSHSGWSTDASAAGADVSNAIDGLLNTRWSDGTAQSGNEWFQVDPGSTRTITAVQLIAAGSIDNDEGDYPRGYQVYTSTGDGWTLAASGTPHGNAVTIPLPSTTARYINVHQTRT